MKNCINILAIVMVFAMTSCRTSSVWDGIKEQYSADATTNQLLLVKYTDGSNADAEFYVKNGKGKWKKKAHCTAEVGKNGIGKEREGDQKTPVGNYGIRKAFGICPNPGTKIEYLDVKEDTYACDEPCEYYNLIIDAKALGHECKGEHMINCAPEYNYGLESRYNDDNVQGKGSAIFIHCKGKKHYTAGCVALDEDVMRTVLVNSDAGLKVCIHPKK